MLRAMLRAGQEHFQPLPQSRILGPLKSLNLRYRMDCLYILKPRVDRLHFWELPRFVPEQRELSHWIRHSIQGVC